MNKIRFTVTTQCCASGQLAVFVNCSQFSKNILIDTNVRIFKDEWDKANCLIVGNPNANKLNLLIRKVIYQLEEHELDYNGDFTLSKLLEIWEGKESASDFYSLMQYQIEHRDIRESTKSTHKNTLKHLRNFRGECSIVDLTDDYVKAFQKYLNDLGLSVGSVNNNMRILRCYYNIACKQFGNKVPKDSFAFYHEKQDDRLQFKMKALSEEDVRKIENYVANPNTPKKEVDRLEKFLFMSYTGCRISDFTSLKEENFTLDNGIRWLTYTSVKTQTLVKIPLSVMFGGRAELLFLKHLNDLESFFSIKDKPHFNIYINKYAQKAGVTKHVTAHVARHTCATRLVNKDVPITTIQKVIGHRSLKMTMVYAKTNECTMMRQLTC